MEATRLSPFAPAQQSTGNPQPILPPLSQVFIQYAPGYPTLQQPNPPSLQFFSLQPATQPPTVSLEWTQADEELLEDAVSRRHLTYDKIAKDVFAGKFTAEECQQKMIEIRNPRKQQPPPAQAPAAASPKIPIWTIADLKILQLGIDLTPQQMSGMLGGKFTPKECSKKLAEIRASDSPAPLQVTPEIIRIIEEGVAAHESYQHIASVRLNNMLTAQQCSNIMQNQKGRLPRNLPKRPRNISSKNLKTTDLKILQMGVQNELTPQQMSDMLEKRFTPEECSKMLAEISGDSPPIDQEDSQEDSSATATLPFSPLKMSPEIVSTIQEGLDAHKSYSHIARVLLNNRLTDQQCYNIMQNERGMAHHPLSKKKRTIEISVQPPDPEPAQNEPEMVTLPTEVHLTMPVQAPFQEGDISLLLRVLETIENLEDVDWELFAKGFLDGKYSASILIDKIINLFKTSHPLSHHQAWAPQDDAKLKRGIFKLVKLDLVSALCFRGLRSPGDCAFRFIEYLNPRLTKAPWTSEEIAQLTDFRKLNPRENAVVHFFNEWQGRRAPSAIAEMLQGL